MQDKLLFTVNCGVYPFDIMVYFGEDLNPLFKRLSKYINKDSLKVIREMNFTSRGKSIMTPCNRTILWMKRKPKTLQDLGTLNHEIFHCACFVLDRSGIPFDESTNEAYAYLIGYLTEKIYSKIGITL